MTCSHTCGGDAPLWRVPEELSKTVAKYLGRLRKRGPIKGLIGESDKAGIRADLQSVP